MRAISIFLFFFFFSSSAHWLDLAMKDIEANNTEKAKTLVDLSKSKEENALKQSRINALLSELLEKRKTIDNLRVCPIDCNRSRI